MQNKILLGIGVLLVIFGLFKPDLTIIKNLTPNTAPSSSVESYVTDAPADQELLDCAKKIISILGASNDSTKQKDCLKLSALYSDMSLLISLDKNDNIIPDTASIKEANSLSGKMLRLNIKDKYPGLAESAKELLIEAIGEDDVVLDSDSRNKAVDAFRALSWAFYEGSK